MGVRFYCSQCRRKLNVKAFQAGRRGLCPYCGASIQIPTQSTRPSSKELRDQYGHPMSHDPGGGAPRRAQPQAQGPAAASSGSAPDLSPSPSVLPLAAVPPPGLNPTASSGLAPSAVPTQPATQAPAQAVSQTPAQPAAQPQRENTGTGQAPPAPIGQPVDLPSPIERPPGSGLGGMAVPSGADLAKAASHAPVPTTQPPAASAGAVDPLAEAPDAIWYVRPPSGGQYGPAAGEVMQAWIAEGRVSPDSLVWREGWRDWKEASDTFPQLGPGKAEPALEAIAATRTASARGAAGGYQRYSRRRSTGLNAAIITALVLAVIVLIAVFIWVLKGGPFPP